MEEPSYGIPKWMESLLQQEKFFTPCSAHDAHKRNEKNVFCLDCCSTLCLYCVREHPKHRFLQVRRHVYHEVVLIDDMEKLLDCSFIQPYASNNKRVVFLKVRAQSRPFRNFGTFCAFCNRALQDEYKYCSVVCKVGHVVRSEGGLAGHLQKCDFLPLWYHDEVVVNENKLPHCDAIDESPVGARDNSLKFDSGSAGAKRTRRRVKLEAVAHLSGRSRRKGIPRRAPMY